MTTTEKVINTLIVVVIVSLILLAILMVNEVTMWKQEHEESKEACLLNHQTIEYELVNGKLYCLTKDGLIAVGKTNE